MTSTFDFSGVQPIADTREPEPVFTPSPQQETIYDWVSRDQGNGMIVAVAGAGKTTTLIEALSKMTGTVAFAAYNKRIADEIAAKVNAKGLSTRVSVKTFHAFGFQVWRKRAPRTRIDDKKMYNLIDDRFPNMPKQIQTFAVKLVSMLKQSGIGYVFPMNDEAEWDRIIYHYGIDEALTNKRGGDFDRDERDMEDLIAVGKEWARKLLQASIDIATEVIDFDDMLFMPMYAGMTPFKYDWVLVDEAQDTNAARLALARAMLKPGGRLLAVGDPRQAIYGFSGADAASLTNITAAFGCKQLKLTVSYRCPQAIVRHAQQWSPEIEAAADAPEGFVGVQSYEELIDDLKSLSPAERNKTVVLCRNNKPVVELAFSLIRQRIACHVEGRDIGGQIKNLANKWQTQNLDTIVANVQAFRDKEVRKLMERKKEARAEVMNDRVDTLLIFIDGVREENPNATLADLNREIDALFEDGSNRGITLSSIHKSKGREWPTVYWLGRNAYQPSPWVRQEWQAEQETNLMYVAATRAQVELIEVVVDLPPDSRKQWGN